jgi:hypothetical protein
VLHYAAVSGQPKVFEVLNAEGEPFEPSIYVYSPGGNPELGTSYETYFHGTRYYAAYAGFAGIYQAVNADGSLSTTDLIWRGPDEKFGTADDRAAKLDMGRFYYLVDAAQGIWEIIAGLAQNPGGGSTVATTTSSTSSSSSSKNNSVSSSSPLFGGNGANGNGNGGSSLVPNTGSGLNTGILICIAILTMGSLYCGYRFFRKDGAISFA